MPSQDLLRHCGDKKFYAYGTARIFERRARRLELGRNWITYLGVAVPAVVGGGYLAFGKDFPAILIVAAGILGVLQLALSLWSLVAKWDDRYAYAQRAMQVHTYLFNAWDALVKRPPADFEVRVQHLDDEDQRQEQSDLTQNISDKEKRFAMRATLYHYGNKCARCGRQPASMTPSNCDTCGNF
jgi:mobilome CxxCx(11)CxxC protein